ncbi:uncharacterized protein LTR77_004942 [Saxophila tyrrhenica]|uniref:BTB domain-containing protein n=1 Tax=Saxophila tyrrhenica TaxID=1690608 RepID=A0AAV9PEP4_9PEZI|nr:hypothetical protein LTR77_004942 [Saxophila tyrrhenica]
MSSEASYTSDEADLRGPPWRIPSQYFNSSTFSDVTLKFSGQELLAHKVILACASPYFKRAFEQTGFKEARSNELVLIGDNPDAVRGLVAWIYGMHYDGRGTYSAGLPPPGITLRNSSSDFLPPPGTSMQQIADVYVVAKKYLVDACTKESLRRFNTMLTHFWTNEDTRDLRKVIEVAKFVYVDQKDSATDLRAAVVERIGSMMEDAEDGGEANEEIRALFAEIRELGFELTVDSVKEAKQLRGKQPNYFPAIVAAAADSSSEDSYFNSPTHSDVTINFSGHQLKAHKIVLSSASDYFQTAFEQRVFQEANTNEIHLQDDDPHALTGLIAWIYRKHYYGRGGYPDELPDRDFDLEYLADVHVTAKKYLVHFAAQNFAGRLRYEVETCVDDAEEVDAVARFVYCKRKDAAVEPRPAVVKCVVRMLIDNGGKVKAMVRKLFADVPELAFDVVLQLAKDVRVWHEYG